MTTDPPPRAAGLRRIEEAFADTLGTGRVRRSVALAGLTTFRTGGPADWLLETRQGSEVARAIAVASELEMSVTFLGGGSNVLVGERGVRGLVIRMWHGEIAEVERGVVRADAGVTINGLVRWTVNRGLAGLQRWAGTPGTVGGGIHGNAHFQGHLLGDVVRDVRLVGRQGRAQTVPATELEFGYDRSRVQHSGEAVLSADFVVGDGDPVVLRADARDSLAYRKRTQPLAAPSAGCIFQNPDPARDPIPAGIPPSAGALVERAGLKGTSIGGATVSPLHGNFIVSDRRATSSDIRRLIERCRQAVRDELGVVLRDEIVYLGEFASETSGPEAV